MNLVLCGILTSLAVVYCVVWDETLVFNMMMCVLCVLAIVSVWSQDSDKKDTAATTTPPPGETADEDSSKQSSSGDKQD